MMRNLVLLMLLTAIGTPLLVGCGRPQENVVVQPNPDLDEAAETRISDVELETKP